MTVIGLDIGGTHTRIALVSLDGKVLASRKIATRPDRGVTATLGAFVDEIERVIAQGGLPRSAVRAIGIGVTGPVNVHNGILENPFTLDGWPPTDIRAPFAESFGVPTLVENDANVAAIGEWWQGAGRAAKRLAVVTIGTGMGVGLLVDGHVQRAPDGRHGEAGHQLLDPAGPPCYCGGRGCWESLASGTALVAQVRSRVVADGSPLFGLCGGDPGRIDGPMIFKAAAEGDHVAGHAVGEFARWLGLGLVNLAAFFAPDTVILSGGVAAHFEALRPTIAAVLAQHRIMVPTEFKLLLAEMGDHAGVLGAAQVALASLEARDEQVGHEG